MSASEFNSTRQTLSTRLMAGCTFLNMSITCRTKNAAPTGWRTRMTNIFVARHSSIMNCHLTARHWPAGANAPLGDCYARKNREMISPKRHIPCTRRRLGALERANLTSMAMPSTRSWPPSDTTSTCSSNGSGLFGPFCCGCTPRHCIRN